MSGVAFMRGPTVYIYSGGTSRHKFQGITLEPLLIKGPASFSFEERLSSFSVYENFWLVLC